jgi:hypothetical protein
MSSLPNSDAAQTRSRELRDEAGATPRNLVTHRASRGGVAPASPGFGPRLFVCFSVGHLSRFVHLRLTVPVKRGVKPPVKARGEVRFTFASHFLSPWPGRVRQGVD